MAYRRGEAPPPPPRAVVITADDGHRSVYAHMFPLVKRYGVPVTLFVYPSAISNAAYAMTWAQLEELAQSGPFDIQSHSYWHPNFKQEKRRLPADQYERLVESQLTKSNASRYRDRLCHGVRIVLADRNALDAARLGVEIASALYQLYPQQFEIDKNLSLIGARWVLEAIKAREDPASIAQRWQASLQAFLTRRGKYLLYE